MYLGPISSKNEYTTRMVRTDKIIGAQSQTSTEGIQTIFIISLPFSLRNHSYIVYINRKEFSFNNNLNKNCQPFLMIEDYNYILFNIFITKKYEKKKLN